MPAPGNEDIDAMLSRAIAMSLEAHPRVEKEENTLIISDQQPGDLYTKLEAFTFKSFQMSGSRSQDLTCQPQLKMRIGSRGGGASNGRGGE